MDLSKLSDADLVALQSGDLSKVSDQGLSFLSQPKQRTWGETGVEAAKNFLPDVYNVGKQAVQAVTSPVQTLSGISDLLQGGLSKVIPESMQDPRAKPAIERGQQAGSAIAQELAKYGSAEGLKEKIATHPAEVLADLSTVLTGAGGLVRGGGNVAANVARTAGPVMPNLAQKAGEIALKAGSYTDPLAMSMRGGSALASGAGSALKHVAGMKTGAGSEAIGEAFKAGDVGGQAGKSFVENLRGEAPMTDVLDIAKSDLQEMGRQKQAEYRANMANVKADQSVLDFNGIDASLRKAADAISFKGQVKNVKAADALEKIGAEIDAWKKLDPVEFHTPEGLDALKQKVGSLLEEIPFEQKSARMAAGDVYNAIKSEITKQAPEYAKTMKAYSEASDQIKEIERALSLGQKASADTAMRKLQSLMRNNANTNYGNRINLAKQLEDVGGKAIMPSLAGQALNQWTPRGLQRATTPAEALAAYSVGGPLLAAGDLALSSPRLVGEVAYKGGQLSRGLRNAGQKVQAPLNAANIDPRILANYLYQINPEGQQ